MRHRRFSVTALSIFNLAPLCIVQLRSLISRHQLQHGRALGASLASNWEAEPVLLDPCTIWRCFQLEWFQVILGMDAHRPPTLQSHHASSTSSNKYLRILQIWIRADPWLYVYSIWHEVDKHDCTRACKSSNPLFIWAEFEGPFETDEGSSRKYGGERKEDTPKRLYWRSALPRWVTTSGD